MTALTSLPQPRTPEPIQAPALRWGILAPGWIARSFAGSLRAHTRQAVQAVGSRSQRRADAFAAEFGAPRAYGSYEALVEDPDVDAVYVASPHSHHAEHALLAIAAGKPVLVEKSFTRNAGEARQVVDAARAAGVLVVEAMWTRFLPSMDIVRQLIADGSLGDIESVVADHGQYFPFDPGHRLYAPALAGGAVLDLGVYPISFASMVLGRPGRVVAVGQLAQTGVERQASVLLDGFGSHPHANAMVGTTLAASTPTTASISGTIARVELPGPFYVPNPVTVVRRDGSRLVSATPPIPAHQGLCYEAAHMAQLVADGRLESPLLGLDETVEVMETMDSVRAQVGAEG